MGQIQPPIIHIFGNCYSTFFQSLILALTPNPLGFTVCEAQWVWCLRAGIRGTEGWYQRYEELRFSFRYSVTKATTASKWPPSHTSTRALTLVHKSHYGSFRRVYKDTADLSKKGKSTDAFSEAAAYTSLEAATQIQQSIPSNGWQLFNKRISSQCKH